MNEQERREILEKALEPYFEEVDSDRDGYYVAWDTLNYERLAKDAIIVPVEVEYQEGGQAIGKPWKATKINCKHREQQLETWWLTDKYGEIPGEGWAIILPRKEEK